MSDDAAGEVLIAGGGPAGAALAMLLHRAGRRITLVSRCRDYRAIEGISRRSLQALQGLGLSRAAACAVGPLPRRVTWAGEARAPNAEWLLPRPAFDAALLEDLRAAGVPVIEARVIGLESVDRKVRCSLADGQVLSAAWGVEARGRAASRRHYRDAATWSSPAWILRGEAAEATPASAALSLPDGGWAWWSRLHGQQYLQLALPEATLRHACRDPDAWLAAQPALAELWGGSPVHHHYRRPSTLGRAGVREGRIWRLGDASMAIDPLSGQGIFNALSSAHGLLPVLDGLLAGEAMAPLQRFHQRRQDAQYWRFARAGRDFYRQAACQVSTSADPAPYWAARCHWPDHQPLHPPEPWARVRVKRGLAIVGTRLAERELVVTPDQPLGIQAVAGVLLAPLVRAMQAGDLGEAKTLLNASGAAAAALWQWWQDHPDWPALPAPAVDTATTDSPADSASQ
ncbi:FAD-dependent oxidoreductase [Billgrantia tianxiuensis]|jgi:2-polyprenyl-6-methoxyphenol hydroxylase-like FAD-dependent oxidoreductase|uniref:FAD-dependent oxidoreductase n=1 Tax=Billgrantia tianxiuensis TaxID=2497861 RepID=A0A6I6SI74_9GAMM|nr:MULTISPECIES: FAD-dependent monooxygenase [Halomonas]MCE8035134.1 FAD-dependent oxidoreductase [Halomonas sp. MCCC 1A11057]QHC48346.1 FAD-dependent oxidoreductase [Halomonas tianxiuensis]